MDSLTLKENGFAEFLSLKDLQFASLPKNKNSVLVLADYTLTGKPTSDIIYIGRSKKPAKKIFGGYLAGYGGKNTRKIHSNLIADGLIEKVIISWMLCDNPKFVQKELLEKFKKEHGEYPVWNAAKKKPEVKSKSATKAVKASVSRKAVKKT
jgi:hypothetical protein